jgi:ribosome-associated translation inhibitor RaiA
VEAHAEQRRLTAAWRGAQRGEPHCARPRGCAEPLATLLRMRMLFHLPSGCVILERDAREGPVAENPMVLVSFKDIEHDEPTRDAIHKRCEALAAEFHEVTRFEITLLQDGVGFAGHGHVTGKREDVGAQATAKELLPAAEGLLDKLERQLRKHHDKRIFAQRREAQRDAMRKKTS